MKLSLSPTGGTFMIVPLPTGAAETGGKTEAAPADDAAEPTQVKINDILKKYAVSVNTGNLHKRI